jgi:nucleoid-associated protein Lsr2
MAQKVLVQLVDDLDGTSSDDVTTVEFGLDGVMYEIDVNTANAERLRKAYEDYIGSARRTGGRLKRGTRPADKSGSNGEAGAIRVWALENGYELAGRGRIPAHVIEAYKEAQQQPAKKTKAVAASKVATRRRTPAKKA